MENIGWIILITFIAGVVGTGIGGLIGAFFKKDSKMVVSLLLSFAGGIMLSVVCFDLMISAIEKPLLEGKNYYVAIVAMFVVVGYIIVYILNSVIDKKLAKEIPHTSKDHPELHDDLDEMIHSDHIEHHKNSDNHLFLAGLVTAAVIALHNLPEGMVIGSTYVGQDVIVGGSGLLIAIVIGLHNIPEGMAVSVPLISGGTKKWKAVLLTALSGLPTVIGAIFGFTLGQVGGDIGLAISLSLASGAMLYVVFGELLPESLLMWRSKLPAFILVIGLLIGFVLVML